MKIHEYQAKQLFKQYGIPAPEGGMADTPAKAVRIAEALGSLPVAIKAQIHAGGRGKGGGVKFAHSLPDTKKIAGEMLGAVLVTHQTGPRGKKVHRILLEKGISARQELYLSILPDRSSGQVLIIAGSAGGMDIEKVAAASPELVLKVLINPLSGIQPHHCRQIAFGLGLPPAIANLFPSVLFNIYKFFVECDCSLVEINPLVITHEEKLVALDAKVEIDPNALFRHPDIAAMQDPKEQDPLEAKAAKFKLNYIKLAGNVSIMVNGAGLAMATMDLIKRAGAEPANFLDVGGGADAGMVEKGLGIVMTDPGVQAVLVNIFGGILRCDVLAEGMVRAARQAGIKVPIVVRMEGTNVKEGRRILNDSGLKLITADNLKDAAKKIAAIIGKRQGI